MMNDSRHISSYSYNCMYMPRTFLAPRPSLGSSELSLMPYACHRCEQRFRCPQALGGHQSAHRRERNEIGLQKKALMAAQRLNVQAPHIAVAPLGHHHMIKKRGFQWLGEGFADGRNIRPKTVASDALVACQKPEESLHTVTYLQKGEERNGISCSNGETGNGLLHLFGQAVQLENIVSANTELTLSSDGIDLSLKL